MKLGVYTLMVVFTVTIIGRSQGTPRRRTGARGFSCGSTMQCVCLTGAFRGVVADCRKIDGIPSFTRPVMKYLTAVVVDSDNPLCSSRAEATLDTLPFKVICRGNRKIQDSSSLPVTTPSPPNTSMDPPSDDVITTNNGNDPSLATQETRIHMRNVTEG
jgi:hypothetical protein